MSSPPPPNVPVTPADAGLLREVADRLPHDIDCSEGACICDTDLWSVRLRALAAVLEKVTEDALTGIRRMGGTFPTTEAQEDAAHALYNALRSLCPPVERKADE